MATTLASSLTGLIVFAAGAAIAVVVLSAWAVDRTRQSRRRRYR